MDWRTRAACRGHDPELFFPVGRDDLHGPEVEAAKAVCAECPVRDDCLDYALATHQPDGIWGGATTTERQAIVRRRARERARARAAGTGAAS